MFDGGFSPMKKEELRFLPETVKGYLDYQTAVRNKSELTVLEYASDLRTFFRWYLMSHDKSKETKPLNDYDISSLDEAFMRTIQLKDLYSFLAYCQRDLKNSGKTRARKASTLRGFFKFLKAHGIIEKNPAEDLDSPRAKKTLPKYLTLDSSIALLDAVDGANYERDYCIITLSLSYGNRV